MTDRTITFNDYHDATGEPVYQYIVRCRSAAQRSADVALLKSQPPARAYTPGLCAGEPFDPPEEPWPSDATARVYPPSKYDTPEQALLAARVIHKHADSLARLSDLPPPCDGPPSGCPEDAGTALALAQHDAAMGGEECTGAACLLTRGSD